MADPGEIFIQRVSALLDIAARIPGRIPGMTAADDDGVVDVIESAQLIVQSAQAIVAIGAGELARRSNGTADASLARRLGWNSAQGVIAAKAGIPFGDASRYVAVGEAIRPGKAASGEDLPADRPHIAAAVLARDLILPVAQLIDRTLDQLSTHMERDLLADVEGALVRDFLTGRYSVAAYTARCKELVDQYLPRDAKARDDALRAKASITETWLPNGMLHIVADLDPEAAGFYRAAMNARTNPDAPPRSMRTGPSSSRPRWKRRSTPSSPSSATRSSTTTGSRPGSTPPSWSASTTTSCSPAWGRRRSTG